MNRVIGMLSGGLGSWGACKLEVEHNGRGNLSLLFADTMIEHPDCYRFLCEGSANILGVEWDDGLNGLLRSIPALEDMDARKAHLSVLRSTAMARIPGLVWLADGRTPFDVYRDERFLGNSRADPCSKILKRELMDRWCDANCDRPTTRSVVGLGWWERERFEGRWEKGGWKAGLRDRMAERGWTFVAPLIGAGLSKYDIAAWAAREELNVSSSYEDGFEHDNCSGFCCKAGHAHFRRLLRERPEVYRWAEGEEQKVRQHLDRDDVACMTERKAGRKVPLTMAEFRQREEAGELVSLFGGEGCGCFVGGD